MSRRHQPIEMCAPLGEARRVRAYRLAEQRAAAAAVVAQIIRETGDAPPQQDEKKRSAQTNGGDTEKLRGIPAIGRGVGGTQAGTDPFREAARRDEQRRRARERATVPA